LVKQPTTAGFRPISNISYPGSQSVNMPYVLMKSQQNSIQIYSTKFNSTEY